MFVRECKFLKLLWDGLIRIFKKMMERVKIKLICFVDIN